jgi:hypothetical protein
MNVRTEANAPLPLGATAAADYKPGEQLTRPGVDPALQMGRIWFVRRAKRGASVTPPGSPSLWGETAMIARGVRPPVEGSCV